MMEERCLAAEGMWQEYVYSGSGLPCSGSGRWGVKP
jgi:hypothetical protein